jgi:hypothetical protein
LTCQRRGDAATRASQRCESSCSATWAWRRMPARLAHLPASQPPRDPLRYSTRFEM